MKIKRIFVPIMAAAMIFTSLVICLAASVQAEAIEPPLVVNQWPVPNSFAVPHTTTVSVQYNQPISPTSVTYRTFAVHAMQSGWISQDLGVVNDTVLLTPTTPFHPGELVQVSATTATVNLSGEGPITPTVWQFWAGVEGGTAAFYDSGQQLGLNDNRGLALGDLDGDGDLDAFVGDIDDANLVYFNDGAGLFTDSGQTLGGMNTLGIALGDLDGDGDLDAFESLAGIGGNPNHIWFNNGNGMFTDSGQNLGNSYSFWIALGDLDGDGDLDAFVPNGNQNSSIPQPNKVYFNDGSGMFIDSGQNLGNSLSVGVSLGDLDGDGDLDAFIANGGFWPDANKVWLNDGTGFFTDTGQLLGNGESLVSALGDLDGDGDLDAFVTNGNEPAGGEPDEVWFNNGSGVFTLTQSLGNGESVGVSLGDLDNDGDLDALACQFDGATLWLNDGTGTFTDSGQMLDFCTLPGLGDLDADGDLDAFLANSDLAPWPNEVWFNANEGWNEVTPYPESLGFYGRTQCPDDPNSIYMVGGNKAGIGNYYSDAFRRYDATTNSWHDLADFPAQLMGMATTCYEDHIYVAGGSQIGLFTTDTFYIYDISANTWITGTNLPRNVSGAALGAWDGYLYLIGGDNATAPPLTPATQVDRYDIGAGVWEAEWGTPMPAAALASSVQAGSVMYMAGGWTAGDMAASSMYTLRYDMAHDSWSWVANFLSRRAVFGLAVTDQYLYAIGGDPADDSNYWGNTNLVERLDWTAWPDSIWEPVASLPLSVSANTAGACTEAMSGGEVWSVAGAIGHDIYTDTTVFLSAEPCFSVAYGLELTPTTTSDAALPGESVTYHLTVTNTGTVPDTYSVTVASLWASDAPLMLGPVDPYQSAEFMVTITVPLAAAPPDSDTATVTVTSVQNPSDSATAMLTTSTLEVPIEGLMAANDGPTELGLATTLTATITAGTNVIYTWDFGDGSMGSGQVVTHVYTSTDTYTATVTASNSLGAVVALSEVTIYQETFDIYLPFIIKPEP